MLLPEDGDRIQSPKHCVLNKNTTKDNVQKFNNWYISVSITYSVEWMTEKCRFGKDLQESVRGFLEVLTQ
jgi:hypothetical protein